MASEAAVLRLGCVNNAMTPEATIGIAGMSQSIPATGEPKLWMCWTES
jgi:hypothetical protein